MNPNDPGYTQGIDISHANGTVDWKAVAQSAKFAFVKATEGLTFTDPLFRQNYERAKTAGLLVGAYCFLRPRSDGRRQAEVFWQAVGELPSLGLCLDVEVFDAQSPAVVARSVTDCVARLTELSGEVPTIYTTENFWDGSVRLSAPADSPLWLARYNVALAYLPLPKGWNNWDFWQWTDKGSAPGVRGPVDLDVFNGTEDELKQWCGLSAQGGAEGEAR